MVFAYPKGLLNRVEGILAQRRALAGEVECGLNAVRGLLPVRQGARNYRVR